MQHGAILLAGGRSVRMGQAMAGLDWHGEPLAARVARVLQRAVGSGPVVAVAAPGRELPPLPAGVELVADAAEGEGPLRGLATGLAALQGRAELAFASSVDAPFLHARFVAALLAAVRAGDDAAVPVAHGHRHPLSAAYRVALGPALDALLDGGERRLGIAVAGLRTRFLDEGDLRGLDDLASADPTLSALRNVNEPPDYEAALRVAPPRIEVDVAGAPRGVRAWRLGEAASAVGVALEPGVVATVDGTPVAPDPWFPLAAGDRVGLRAGGD